MSNGCEKCTDGVQIKCEAARSAARVGIAHLEGVDVDIRRRSVAQILSSTENTIIRLGCSIDREDLRSQLATEINGCN